MPIIHRYDYRVIDLAGKTSEQVLHLLTEAAREGYRLLPMAYAGQSAAILERPHEEDEFESMSEEEKQKWFAENIEYNRVSTEWKGT